MNVSYHINRFSVVDPSWDKPELIVKKQMKKKKKSKNFNILLDSMC